MSIFLLKSVFSLIMLSLAVFCAFTMFEVFGRNEKRFNSEMMIKMHKIGGIAFIVVFIVIAYFCLSFIVSTKSELSSRSTFHAVFALSILTLFALKLCYTRLYRLFYENVKTIGLLMALLTFGLVGTSGGYYLLVSEFGTDPSFDRILQYKKSLARSSSQSEQQGQEYMVVTDPESIGRGKNMFDSRCKFCHHANSTETIVGPGLKGILSKKELPISGRAAIPENIIRQLKRPLSRMPSFDYLTEGEISDIIAYLNTL